VTGRGTLRYEFQLTPAELRAVVLFSMLRRPGEGFRRLVAIAVGGIALMWAAQGSGWAQVGGVTLALACGWIALRPVFLSRVMAQKPAPKVTLELSERGVKVIKEGKAADFAWSRITAQGKGPGFYWYEVQRAAIAVIPDRVVDDRAALEALLARAGSS
jgi:hypothetical protein